MNRSACLVLPSLLLICCLIELFLRLTDPLGIAQRFEDVRSIEYGETRLVPGEYRIHGSETTIGEDGRRIVPETNLSADCTIAFIGDSVTFGWGVGDEETFVTLIAREMPDVHFINAAVPSRDNLELLDLMQDTPADGYIYLIWENDVQDIQRRDKNRTGITWGDRKLYTWWYLKSVMAAYSERPAPVNMEDFWQALAGMAQENTLFFVLEENPLSAEIATRYPDTVVIGWRYDTLSWADGHPDKDGHREAARLMMLAVREFVERVCNE